MPSVMELFIIVILQLLIKVQSSEYSNIKVSPDVVKESDSVHLICESPQDVKANLCYFHINGEEEKNIKLSPSCNLKLTGAEVLLWTGFKSPKSIDIGCLDTVNVNGVQKPSHHSSPVTLTILDTLIKPIMGVNDSGVQLSILCAISMSVRADFICNLYTEDGHPTHRSRSQRTQTGYHACFFYLHHNEIFTQKTTVNSVQLSCDYSVKTDPGKEINLRSPRSNVFTIRGFPRPVLTVSSSVITDTDTVQIECMNRENQNMDMCSFTIDGMDNKIKQSKSCQLSLIGSYITHWSGGQRSSVIITCFYTVNKSQVSISSRQSDPVTVTFQATQMSIPANPPVIEPPQVTSNTRAQTLTVKQSTTTSQTTTTAATTVMTTCDKLTNPVGSTSVLSTNNKNGYKKYCKAGG